jgi:Super-infection exclusion protein B
MQLTSVKRILQFRQLYRGYLGGAFVASISLLAAYGLSAGSDMISSRLDDRRLRRLTLKTLSTLTSDEKRFLRGFIVEGRNTVHASISDGVSGGLVAKCIVYRSSNIIERFAAPFNLQPIARELLTKNPRLLD